TLWARSSRGSRSELVEVLIDLEGGVLAVEGAGFRSLDGQELVRQRRAEGGRHHGVALERVQRSGERGRIATESAPGSLTLGERVRVDEGGFAGIELSLEPVEPGRQQSAQSQVRIAGRITGLELEVGGLHLEATTARGQAQGRFLVVGPPRRVGA